MMITDKRLYRDDVIDDYFMAINKLTFLLVIKLKSFIHHYGHDNFIVTKQTETDKQQKTNNIYEYNTLMIHRFVDGFK